VIPERDQLVSVIVPTRNSSATIAACLSSIKRQTYSSIELIVVDNNSTDNTISIAKKFTDKVFNKGPERCAQRNFGASKATGDYLMFVDSDQCLEDDVVVACVKLASKYKAIIIPEESIGVGFLANARALERSCYTGDDDIEGARFFTRKAFDYIGGYDEDMRAAEDWDIHLRVVKAGNKIGRIKPKITHLENRVTLRDAIIKKVYYGKDLRIYIRKHPKEAKRQFRLIRPAFIRNWRRLIKDPLHTCGFFFLKSVEFGAGSVGYLQGWISERTGKVGK
jgi:glycosyltransferase involved in cell wall biosynthesis